MANNIVLIGMRGSGKTTVSEILGEKTGFPVIDADKEITAIAGMSIKDMVEHKGWEYFRDQETAFLQNLSVQSPYILSTGGGMPVREKNRPLLKKLGSVYYLYGKPEILAARVTDLGDSRLIITDSDSFLQDQIKLFEERKDIYTEVADQVIHTEQVSPDEVANTIIAYYKFVHRDEYHS